MPFSWKKAKKFGQIPQLISDLKSKRNRSSLNLETGFPTSLADFIVKNRDRLKKSRKQSEKSYPSGSDLVVDGTQSRFVNPSSLSCSSPVNRPSPAIIETGSGLETSGKRTENDTKLGELLGHPLPSPVSLPNGLVDFTSPSQRSSSLEGNKPEQLLPRIPPLEEAVTSSSQRSRLEEKRREKIKSGALRRLFPPRKEVAISASPHNSSTKNAEKCNLTLRHTSSSAPENQLERRREKNKHEQPSPSAVRHSDERAERFKPEQISSLHESRPEKGKRDKFLRHPPARKLEVLTSSASKENLSLRIKKADADGELPALPFQRKLSVASMMFFVLVLALGTKEITLVMTISVLLLFLLEIGNKSISFCFKRREQGKKISTPPGKSGCSKVDVAFVKGKRQETSFREIQTEPHSTSDSKNKVKLFDTHDFSVRKEGCCDLKEFESMNWKSEVNLVYIENVSIQKEGSVNFKAKWKKLMLKKFHVAKGGKVCQDQEGSSGLNSELLDCGTDKEDEVEGAGEEVGGEGIKLGDEKVCLARKWNVGHLVFFVAVLVGLLGGRVIALALTVAWVLLIKSAETLWNKLKS